MNRKRKIKFIVFSLLLSAVIALSGFMVWRELTDRQKEQETFASLSELAQTKPETSLPESTKPPEADIDTVEESEPEAAHKRNIPALTEENPDCVGWLSIDGTAVDYPVMHMPDEPQRYLRLDFYGSYSASGVPFLDGRCSLGSSNRIIYGHNMKNGTMFSSLKGYADKEYCLEHPVIEFETAAGCESYAVFAVAAVRKDDGWYDFITAAGEVEYDRQIETICGKALYDTGVIPVFGQQLLTLSTCYGAGKDGRLIVIAVKQ